MTHGLVEAVVLTIPPGARTAWVRLLFKLDETGTPACSSDPDSWANHANNVEDQQYVARLCQPCLARVQCRDFAHLAGEAGVWGGEVISPEAGRARAANQRAATRATDRAAADQARAKRRVYVEERRARERAAKVARTAAIVRRRKPPAEPAQPNQGDELL